MDSFDTESIQAVGQMITDTIDFEQSQDLGRVVVKDGVDERLDTLRYQYNGMEDMLGRAARDLADSIFPEGANQPSLNIVYFPQIGYLISVPSVTRLISVDGISESGISEEEVGPEFVGDDWEFAFSTATTWYYKNPGVIEMDEHYGDTYGMIGGKFLKKYE